tara:strand:+ start:131 stop:727 length:597 start_codon:yes stop_codon:yes gene_type:complete
MIGNRNQISWFREWISQTFDLSKGRVVVHLPAAGTRLRKLKPIIIQMVKVCEEYKIAIEFNVTSGDGEYLDQDTEGYSEISVYSIKSFLPSIRANGSTLHSEYKYDHQIIVRRTDIKNVYASNEITQVDIIIFSFAPDCSESRWKEGAYNAIDEELFPGGLIIRTCNTIDLSPISNVITSQKIPVGDQYNWYDVWQKK